MSSEAADLWGIRPARVDDEAEVARLYEVCLRTGANGGDATSMFQDPRILGDVFVGPYLRFEPGLAWVVAKPGRLPAGFVLGTADTERFESTLDEKWWPALRAGRQSRAAESETGGREWGDAPVWQVIEHPPTTPREVTQAYPAHLHIDLLPEAQGGGNGGRLIKALLAALRDRGVIGVHLGVGTGNANAIGFYRHLGFHLIADEGDFLRLGLRLIE